MILIAERINGMFKDVKQAIADKNKSVIQGLAARQTEAGANYLDVNVGTAAADQQAAMQWLVETIQQTCSTPLSLDSQKPDVIAAGLKVVNAENGVLLNSTPLNKKSDEDVFYKYIEMAEQAGAKTVCRRTQTHVLPSLLKSFKRQWKGLFQLSGCSLTLSCCQSKFPMPRCRQAMCLPR